ncbi:GTP cyclohydrolase II [Silicimonas sp. MF1-12-2]|uniref:GTP cyclohydrolase II n=1 Tax=Silicimonas sp. MF1-12-2 TaxID=3384793 RepID=UPI0039B36B55
MSLIPTPAETLARARTDLRLGLPVVLESAGEKVLVTAAEGLSEDRLRDIIGIGPSVLAITARRAETLRARAYDGDVARLVLPPAAKADWIRAAADPKDDLATPMKGPFESAREGSADLHRLAIGLAKSAHLLPAALVTEAKGGIPEGLTWLKAKDVAHLLQAPTAHKAVVTGRVPLGVSEAGRVHVFRPEDGGEEHYVCEIGRPPRDRPVLARLHSACFTGDVLGSLKCDCGAQLQTALRQMGEEGAGVLLYLNQEGRGIGLANKMRAYALQDQGFDTVEANHRLGFEDDERDFRVGADILKRLGFNAVRLLTNNPAKVRMMEAQGIAVAERVPLKVGLNPLNERYLDVKAKKSGHIL